MSVAAGADSGLPRRVWAGRAQRARLQLRNHPVGESRLVAITL